MAIYIIADLRLSENNPILLNAFSNFYALAVSQPINGIDRIIFNIVELGGRDAVKRIIERKNKK